MILALGSSSFHVKRALVGCTMEEPHVSAEACIDVDIYTVQDDMEGY